MWVTKKYRDVFAELVIEVEVFQRVVGNLDQSLGRPGHVVNDGGIVDEAWIHPTVITKVITCLAH